MTDAAAPDTLHPRPVDRIIVEADGRVYPLTVPVVFGRDPALARIRSGRIPRLVPLPSPTGQLSATHCEVRMEGRTVVITDLKSRNGTIVHQPHFAPRRLRQWESIVVATGTEVDLAGEALLRILADRDDEAPADDAPSATTPTTTTTTPTTPADAGWAP